MGFLRFRMVSPLEWFPSWCFNRCSNWCGIRFRWRIGSGSVCCRKFKNHNRTYIFKNYIYIAYYIYIRSYKGRIVLNEPTQLIIKPYKDNYIAWIISICLVYIIACGIGITISIAIGELIPWKTIGIGFIICSVMVCLIAGIARLSYKGELIVTSDEIIKVHGKKIQVQIKRENIVSICIRKVNPFLKLLVVISGFIGDICTDLIFFRFYHAEIFEKRKFCGVIEQHSLSDEDDKELQEFAESVTYKQAKKISEILEIPFIVIKN